MVQGNWWKCLGLAGLLGVWMLSAAVSSESGSQPSATLADEDHEGDSEEGELLADDESEPGDPELPDDEDFEGETEGPGDELYVDHDDDGDHEDDDEGELVADHHEDDGDHGDDDADMLLA